MTPRTRCLVDHSDIRAWAEARGGQPRLSWSPAREPAARPALWLARADLDDGPDADDDPIQGDVDAMDDDTADSTALVGQPGQLAPISWGEWFRMLDDEHLGVEVRLVGTSAEPAADTGCWHQIVPASHV